MWLNDLLSESKRFSAEYGRQLSNHLPMALIALDRLGASEEQAQKFFNQYSKMLRPQAAVAFQMDASNWITFLGQHEHNSEYREYFLQEFVNKGFESTLKSHLPLLIPGLSGGAFHPLIRLAYAIEIKSEWEIAESLAAWAMAYLELGEFSDRKDANKNLDFETALQNIREDLEIKSNAITGANVFARMKNASGIASFKNLVNQIGPRETEIQDLARIAIKLYRSSGDNFTALHGVTFLHAARIVNPYVQDKDKYIFHLWQGLAAAYVSIGCIDIQVNLSQPVQGLLSWEQIFKAAVTAKDDHVIKFCYTAFSEWQKYGDESYRAAASLKCSRL
jgi:hypothetical protein